MENTRVKIGLVQSAAGDDPDSNLERAIRMVSGAAARGAEIICLQELFRSPYFPQYPRTDARRYAETIPGPTTRAMSELAGDLGVVVIAPLFEQGRGERFYNSAAVILPDGSLGSVYRKVHIPEDPLYHEKQYFSPGAGYTVTTTPFGPIAVLICYDQWFPEAARAVALQGAGIIFYPTALGTIRGLEVPREGDWQAAWETVQRGHAIASGVHVAAVNRVGTEGDLSFFGGSFVCDAFGNVLCRAGKGEEVLVTGIDYSMNRAVREGWGFLENRRPDTYGLLLRAGPSGTGRPAGLGFRMPAEWEPHQAVWLSWPHDNDTFPDLAAVEDTYLEIIRALQGREKVFLLVTGPGMHAHVTARLRGAGLDGRQVRLFSYPYADVWFRDYGPTFLVHEEEPSVCMVDWTFNAWGEKYPELMADDAIPGYISRTMGIPAFSPGIVMEGGSIDVNGRGALMTTEQCLLNPNRNPGLSREAIEGYFREYLGISRVIWLRGGIAGDDTDGHVDDVARFAGDTTVLCAVEKDPGDKNHAVLAENFRILTSAGDQGGKPLHVVPLPMPGRCGGRNRVPASYANFYIGNGVVLVPVFDDPADNRALEVIGRAFPDRKIIGIDCRAMVEGMGAIHCISQQLPAP